MGWVGVLSVSIANNLDNLAVGVSYGVANIRIRWLANLWMGAVQLAITAAAVYFGQWLAHWASPTIAPLGSGRGVFRPLGLIVGRPPPQSPSPAPPPPPA